MATATVRTTSELRGLRDPVVFAKVCWPHINLYDKQRAVLWSYRDNLETYVPATKKGGKDFLASIGNLWAFVVHDKVRVILTSVKWEHTDVGWTETMERLNTSVVPLRAEVGGPLLVKDAEINKVYRGKEIDAISYFKRMVSETGEGLSGHHAPYTFCTADEATALPDMVHTAVSGWCKRFLCIFNCNETQNFVRRAVDAGSDVPNENWTPTPTVGRHGPARYLRKIIRITGADSPNVKRGFWQLQHGLEPTGAKDNGELIIPGVLEYQEYVIRRKTWDAAQQAVGLDGVFYVGKELLLYPPEWLSLAEQRHDALAGKRRVCKGIGMDPAEGGDSTAMCAVDEYGIIELVARKTPNTDDIPRELMAFMVKHKMVDKADRVCIDRGGGKQHADRLRALGYRVRTVAFGESVQEDPKSSKDSVRTKVDQRESRYEYKTRRAQMFGELSELLDPGIEGQGPRLAIPRTETVLRQEMAPIPKTYDEEGRLTLIPKHAKPGDKNPDGTPKDKRKCLVGLIGHSPDRLDAFALAVHAMLHESPIVRVGAASWGVG